MKLTRSRVLKGAIAAAASAMALGGTGVVYGQAATPTPRAGPPFGPWGWGAPAGTDATCPLTGAPIGAMAGWGAGEGLASDAVLKQLGMTAEQLLAERRAGTSLAQIAQARGVGKDALIATILDAHKASLDAAVNAGRLAQAQADAMQAMMQARVAFMVDQTVTGPGAAGGRGMMGPGSGMMGRGFGPG
jgi:hypothetical protein